MATAGVETPLATGALPNFDEAQAAASGVQPNIPAAPDPTDPNAVVRGAGPRRTRSLQPGGPYAWRPTQQDYYGPDAGRPTMYQMKTGLVPVAHAGQIPFAVLANREQAVAEQKRALQKQVSDFDLYANIGSAPDPYQESFRNLATSGMDQKWKQVVDTMYGGNEREAILDLPNNPRAKRFIGESAKHYELLGAQAKYWSAGADEFLKGAESGAIAATPEDKKNAQDLKNGLNAFGGPNGPDVSELVAKGKRFDQTTSENEWINKMVRPVAEHALKTLESNGRAYRGPNGYVLMDKNAKKTYDDFVDEQVGAFVDHNGGTREEARKKLQAYFPTSQEIDTKGYGPQGGEAAAASQPTIGAPEVGQSINEGLPAVGMGPQDMQNNNITRSMVETGFGGNTVIRTPISTSVGKELPKIPMTDKHGNKIEILPKHITTDVKTGEVVIEGDNAEVQQLDTEAKKLELKIGDYTSQIGKLDPVDDKAEREKLIQDRDNAVEQLDSKKKKLQYTSAPIKGNESTVRKFLKDANVDQAIQQNEARRKAHNAAPKTADPLGIL